MHNNEIDGSKTLEEIEEVVWGEPQMSSNLVLTAHALRKKPLKDFTAGDLRLMIGQQLSLEHLVPIALDVLGADPFVCGNSYRGDLLEHVLKIPSSFWESNTALYYRLDEIVTDAQSTIESVKPLLDSYKRPY
ncbi:contact-dependent growth inhibition system immunity protein [Paenibacillus sp. Soil522]|uniref:contact-dependent growth inhibition system immunity protein n=1 Tax=Paenibacillus sp. Soil522 TaxID=1736388 RepID=UPI0006F9054D|nr:contact-dependent growth inhibition system immunity protein [Paenibacillus sp. Soil522]KRE33487.1 hypothetical protein ASG81_23345 [Paenibacillus sp. Soil522]